MSHHDQLVHHLKSACDAAGGPISLPRLLRLAAPTIQALLDNGVPWRWSGARVLAVHRNPEGAIPPDIPDLDASQVRRLAAEYSRQKRRRSRSTRAPPPGMPDVNNEAAVPMPDKDTDRVEETALGGPPPPYRGSRASIHAAAKITNTIGKLQT